MPDLYAREVARYRRERSRFEVIEVDVYQRGAGHEADDVCHLRALHVVVPSGALPRIVDALIAAVLLQLQQQADGEAVAVLADGERQQPPVSRRGVALGVQPVTPEAIAEAARHYGLVSELRALEARAQAAEAELTIASARPISVEPLAPLEAEA
ncbi:MAG: hypothetical protein FJ035_01195 [Chloroflexi bacterium]|nr:hypothetical protein [Chloroflexota bacterium]